MHTRQLGPELARILAMAAIVAGHYRFQNGITGGYLVNFLTSAPNIAVNLFLLIGVWFMVGRPFRPERPLKIHATLIFYGWLITAIVTATAGACLQHILQGFFPFLLCPLWFATAYIFLLFLAPYLDRVNQFDKPHSAVICLIVPTLVSIMTPAPWGHEDGLLGGILWFICVYLFMSHLKFRTRFFKKARPRFWITSAICIYLVLIAIVTWAPTDSMLHLITTHSLGTIQALPNFLIAFGLLIGFLSIKRNCPHSIQAISTSTFAIYVIHQMACFIVVQWGLVQKILPLPLTTEIYTAIDICFVVILLFAVYTPIDRLRVRFIEPLLLNSRPYKWIAAKLKFL